MARTASRRPRRPRRTWPQRLFISLNLVVILGCLAGAAGLLWGYTKVTDLQRVDLGTALTPNDEGGWGGPQNFLVVGVDSGEGLDPDDPAGHGRPGGLRSDVIMVMRVDPTTGEAAILSFPRDLYVRIAGSNRQDRINSAIANGPDRLIETIRSNFDIEINHYIQVDFAGFEAVVRAVDGVPMYFEYSARDTKSFLTDTGTGCVVLNPRQALAYARSRSFQESVNGRWRTDPTGDFGRITRQQELIRKVIQRAIDKGARNPVVLNQLVDAGIAAVKLDPTLTPNDLLKLANQFRDFSPETLQTYAVPGTPVTIGGASVVRMNAAEAEPMLARFRSGAGSSLAQVTLRVVNGSGRSGLGSQATADFRAAGFTISAIPTGDADRFDYAVTEIWYGPGQEAEAQVIASVLAPGAIVKPGPEAMEERVRVVVGADYVGVDGAKADLDPIERRQGTRLPAQNPSSTTTTATGAVPESPEGARC